MFSYPLRSIKEQQRSKCSTILCSITKNAIKKPVFEYPLWHIKNALTKQVGRLSMVYQEPNEGGSFRLFSLVKQECNKKASALLPSMRLELDAASLA